LSVTAVTIGRNDDYMVDFEDRLHASIGWNLQYLIDDVVFVEWNPPANRDLLAPRLTARFPRVRAYVVTAETHRALNPSGRIPLLEYHAKNVGVRRARSDWVIATNADALFAPDTVVSLRREPPRPDQVLTAQRFDIPWKESRRRAAGPLDCLVYKRVIPYDPLGTGEFLMAHRSLWERARGYDESLVMHRIGCDVRGVAQMRSLGATLRRAGSVLHMAHPTSCTEGVRPFHGEHASLEGVPYENREDWGLASRREVSIAERVWRLE
jgi:hypothetical protein